MKKICIGFSRPKKWKLLSYLIRKAQNTEYSHVYIKFYSSSLDREIIYQASGLQVNFIGSLLFHEEHLTVKSYTFEVEDEAYKNAMIFAVDKAGMPYSIKQLFHILTYMITGKDTYFKTGIDGYICSELVYRLIENTLNVKISIDANLITPKDIDMLLEKLYGKTE